VVVFSERDIQTESPDEAFVRRCWKRDESDFSALKAAVAAQQIELLHINMHSVRFFKQPGFTEFLAWARSSGIVVVAQLHSTFTRDAMFTGIVSNADCILVHTEQNRLEVIANGARADQVLVIPHGVERMPELSSAERAETRARLAIPEKSQVILAFGFIQPHKGMEGVLEAVLQLRAQGKDVVGLIVGGINPSDPQSAEYRQRLEELAQQHNLTGMVRFIDGFVSDSEVTDYLRVADLVLMNYRSQHYEASGACSLAVGAGAVILTSGAPPFISFGDAVWHLTAGYPPALSADLLLSNPELYQTIKANCAEYARRFSWESVAQHLKEIYRGMGVIPEVVQQIAVTAVAPEVEVVTPAHTSEGDSSPDSTPLRVLIQNRPGTFTQRGGDTIVIEHTAEQLRKLGVQVTIDIEMKHDPKNFDIVHLFNFATPDLTRKLGERAKHAGVPFVVTTLLEDLALFHNQSHAAAEVLVEYVRRGQDHQVGEVEVGPAGIE
jgi:glycosyltransferase involved in cell wall biosynthesis